MSTEFEAVNQFEAAVSLLWNTIWKTSGCPQAQYLPKDEQVLPEGSTFFLLVDFIPYTPLPDGFGFEDIRIYKTSRIISVRKSDLYGIVPKEGDTVILDETEYIVKKTQGGPCWEDADNCGFALKIHLSKNRV